MYGVPITLKCISNLRASCSPKTRERDACKFDRLQRIVLELYDSVSQLVDQKRHHRIFTVTNERENPLMCALDGWEQVRFNSDQLKAWHVALQLLVHLESP